MTTKIPSRIIEILRGMKWDHGVCRITEQLDYKREYKPTDKILQSLGGTWVRKIKGHEFDGDGELLVRSVIDTGEYIDPKRAYQFFETPEKIAGAMCDLAGPLNGKVVLEPSAGKGRIAKAAKDRGAAEVRWVELDPSHERHLKAISEKGVVGDFLGLEGGADADAVVMNPPFRNQQDIKHIRHAWSFMKPGGTLVAISSPGFTFREDRICVDFRAWLSEIGAKIETLPAGTFKSSGTMINTCMIHATKGT